MGRGGGGIKMCICLRFLTSVTETKSCSIVCIYFRFHWIIKFLASPPHLDFPPPPPPFSLPPPRALTVTCELRVKGLVQHAYKITVTAIKADDKCGN